MKRRKTRREEVNRLPIINENLRKNKEGLVFLSHKIFKYRLAGAWVSRGQYFKILKILKELGIISDFSTRGIRYKKVKEK